MFIGFGFSGSLHAEPLPSREKVEQIRDNTLRKAPFQSIKTQTEYCWIKCGKEDNARQQRSLPDMPDIKAPSPDWFNGLMYALIVLLLALVLWVLYRWYRANGGFGFGLNQGEEVPETLFGMKITPESLPKDVASTVLAEYERDPRAAMSQPLANQPPSRPAAAQQRYRRPGAHTRAPAPAAAFGLLAAAHRQLGGAGLCPPPA